MQHLKRGGKEEETNAFGDLGKHWLYGCTPSGRSNLHLSSEAPDAVGTIPMQQARLNDQTRIREGLTMASSSSDCSARSNAG